MPRHDGADDERDPDTRSAGSSTPAHFLIDLNWIDTSNGWKSRRSKPNRHLRADAGCNGEEPDPYVPCYGPPRRGWIVLLFDQRPRWAREATPYFDGGAQMAVLNVFGESVLSTHKSAKDEEETWRFDNPELDFATRIVSLDPPSRRVRRSVRAREADRGGRPLPSNRGRRTVADRTGTRTPGRGGTGPRVPSKRRSRSG